MREFVNPNLHVAIIHFPMGLLFAGILIELFSFLGWRRGGFRAAGRWMILLGTLSAIPTALSGIYALNDVMRQDLPTQYESGTWRDVLQHSRLVTADNGEAWEHMSDHALIQSISTGIAVLVVLTWLSASDNWRSRLHVPLVVVMLGAVGAMSWGAWESGEGIYSHGVGVDIEHPNGAGGPATAPATRSSEDAHREMHFKKDPAFYLPPMEGHIVMAGWTVALAVVALGLAIRNATAPAREVEGMDDIAAALGPSSMPPDEMYGSAEQRALLDRQRARHIAHYRSLPAARFWLIAALLGVITASFGIWILSRPENVGTWDPRRLVAEVFEHRGPDNYRRCVHVITGSSIVTLALLMAIFTRIAPRQKFIILLLGLLLVIAVAVQVWLGVLLTFDTPIGPLRAFN